MRLRTTVLIVLAFLLAAVAAAFVAGGSATIIEKRSRLATRVAMEEGGHGWVHVETDGLQVILFGTAPTEAERFRAVTRATAVVDASRIVDNTDVASIDAMTPPAFSVRMLRNEDGIQLIGLVPAGTDRAGLVARLRAALKGGAVTDMLETASFPAPPGWTAALNYGADAMQMIQRAKVSVDPGAVRVEAMADSPTEKTRIETSLARARPSDVRLSSEISAPRPVIAPFTLRFLIDKMGARFDACSADSERTRDRILDAARAAGATGTLGCAIGMGSPSPQWGEAVDLAIRALGQIGSGVVTFSDTDVFLSANPEVATAQYDHAIGELESNLPKVFTLHTELQAKPAEKPAAAGFSAVLNDDGKIELRGRMTDARARTATESFARAEFGAEAVHGAMRLDPEMPQGWPTRVMTALQALSSLSSGTVEVTPDSVHIAGVSGDPQASDTISRVLSGGLGSGSRIAIDVHYDRHLDPALNLPDGPGCTARLNEVLKAHKIAFEPGSAVIAKDALPVIDLLAKAMKDCQEFPMEIGGHTDSQGSDEMNLALSQDRAQSVLAALQGRGLWTGNLTAKGYGEARPIDTNDTEAGRENNRRIEFRLIADADTAGAEPVSGSAPDSAPKPAARPEGLMPDQTGSDQTGSDQMGPATADAGEDGAPMDGTDGDSGDGAPMDGAPEDDTAPANSAANTETDSATTSAAASATTSAAPADLAPAGTLPATPSAQVAPAGAAAEPATPQQTADVAQPDAAPTVSAPAQDASPAAETGAPAPAMPEAAPVTEPATGPATDAAAETASEPETAPATSPRPQKRPAGLGKGKAATTAHKRAHK